MRTFFSLLVLVFFVQSCRNSPQGPSDSELMKMTRFEKWESLERGMSEETVFRILGKPSTKENWSGQTSYKFECFLCGVTFDENGVLWSWNSPSEELN